MDALEYLIFCFFIFIFLTLLLLRSKHPRANNPYFHDPEKEQQQQSKTKFEPSESVKGRFGHLSPTERAVIDESLHLAAVRYKSQEFINKVEAKKLSTIDKLRKELMPFIR